jgi:hypothetical protein
MKWILIVACVALLIVAAVMLYSWIVCWWLTRFPDA